MAQYELNLRDYLVIFRKRKLVVIITFLFITAMSIYHSSKQGVVYRASTTVKVSARKNIAGLLTEWIVYNPAEDTMQSETKIIEGFPIMKKVALRLGLVDTNSTLEDINDAVGSIQGSLQTEKVEDTNMIKITATSATAKEAVDLANTIAAVYIEENLADKVKESRQTREFIEEQLSSIEDRLKKSEEQLRASDMTSKNLRLYEPIQNKLISLEFELNELLRQYTEKHPRVMQLREQIKGLEAQLVGFSEEEIVYARLSREVEVSKKLYALLKEKLEEARITEASRVPDVAIVNPAVDASAVSVDKKTIVLAGMVMGMILGTAFAFFLETFDTSISRIEDVENVVKLPVLGIVPTIAGSEGKAKKGVLESIKSSFGVVAQDEKEERAVRLSAHYKPSDPSTEAYRNIFTNLKIGPSRKTILVASSSPREGKTNVVCGLGIVAAQTGLKTLLVSTDLRRPTLAKTFGIKREPGLNEFITGSATLEDALRNITDIMLGELGLENIRKTPGLENIWIFTSGYLPDNPTELLGTNAMTTLIGRLKTQFDLIIFDSSPVLPVADASILAPKMDCTVIVYEIGRTSREALLRTKVQLESAGAKISGVILNHTRPEVEAISPYPYYYKNKYRYYKKEGAQEQQTVKK